MSPAPPRKMVRSLCLFILLSLSFLTYLDRAFAAAPGEPPLLSQDLSVSLLPERHMIKGESTVTLQGGGTVQLFLIPSATVERVSVAGERVPFLFRDGTISVEIPGRSKGPVRLTVAYHAFFNDEVASHPASSEEPTYGVSGAITPRGTFLGAGSRWYPTPAAIPPARTVRVDAPPGTEALSYGRRASRETTATFSRSTWVEAHPVGELSLSAGPYQVAAARAGETELYTYLYPENAHLSARYLEAAARYLRFYSGLFGAYPFEKFAVVENFFPTGYGLPSYTLLGSTVIRLPFIINTSFPHEIAHSWWGNAIEADPRHGNWAEGLVTYLADYLLKEQSSPQEAREYRLQILSDYATLVSTDRDFPLSRFMGRVDPPSRAIGYGKGAMLFHMIRRRIGDEAFFRGLRDVSETRLYGEASWDDFGRAFSRRGGEDLSPFMKQWLTRPGGPRLSLAGVTRRRTGKGWTVSGTVAQASPLFAVQVPIRVETEQGSLPHSVLVSGERTPFSIDLSDPPARLLLDPDAEVFRILSREELPATVNRIKGARRVTLVTTKGCRARPETLKHLLESLDQRDAAVVSEEGLDPSILRESDVVFCGAPRPALLPPLPREIALSGASFSVEGERYDAPGDLLFLVGENRHAPGQVAALFLPLSEEAAERYVPKITHYGKYGYLVFSAGQNRRKGTFAQPVGPSAVLFE